MIDTLNNLFADAGQMLINGIKVLSIAFVGVVFWKTKALAPTLGALLLAGLVIWGVTNTDWFERQVGNELNSAPISRSFTPTH